jgi:ATP-dependent protease ClpP protease subunit
MPGEQRGAELVIGGEIVLHGYVGEAWDGFTSAALLEALAIFSGQPVTVRLNSIGGIASDGAAMRAALAGHDGGATVLIEGVAASAASLIAMGGARIEIAADALLMIHEPANMTMGDAAEHLATAARLEILGGVYADAYAARSGRDPAAVRAMMQAETWFTAAEAVAAGFADAVVSIPAARAALPPVMLGARGDALPERFRAAALAAGWTEGGSRDAARRGAGDTAAHLRGDSMTDEQKAAKLAADKMAADKLTADARAAEKLAADAAAAAGATMTADDAIRMVSDAVRIERDRVAEIARQGASMSIPHEAVAKMIADGVTVADAPAAMIAAWMAAGARPLPGGRAPAEVRGARMDEGDTKRLAIGAAMVARMGGAAPEHDAGRAFMDLSVAEMAADMIGDRGPLRTHRQKERVIMSAMHTGSDFSGIVDGAMNRRLVDVYENADPVYRQISREISFADFRVHPQVLAGGLPGLQPIGQSGAIKLGTLADSKETAILRPFGVVVPVGREVFVNDDLGALDRAISGYGNSAALFEDATWWAVVLAGLMADGVGLWATAKGNASDGVAALTVEGVSLGRAAIRVAKKIGGEPLNIPPAWLVVGPENETAAEQICSPIAPTTAAAYNPFAGKLSPLVTASMPAGEWALFTSPMLAEAVVHGWLDGASAPRVRVATPMGQSGISVEVTHDFGVGLVSRAPTYRGLAA